MGIVRLLLALSVMLSHGGPWLGLHLVPPAVAVQTFFMVSGFYMAMVLRGKYLGPGALKKFYVNRFLKLFPAYWTVALLTLAACITCGLLWKDWSILTQWKNYSHRMSFGSRAFLVVTQLIVFGQDAVMFTGVDRTGALEFARDFRHSDPQLWTFLLVPQAWSLSLELMFYAIAPWLVRLSARWLGVSILAALLLRGYLGQQLGLTFDPWTYRFFPSEIAMFMAGILSHNVFLEGEIEPYLKKISSVFGWIFFASTGLYATASQGVPEFRWVYFGLAFVGIPAIFTASKASKADRAIGDLSFPLYIGHYGVFEIVKRVAEHTHARYLNADVEYVAAFLFAFLLNKLVMEPLEGRRQKVGASISRVSGEASKEPREVSERAA